MGVYSNYITESTLPISSVLNEGKLLDKLFKNKKATSMKELKKNAMPEHSPSNMNKDNRVKTFQLLDAKKNLYISDSTIKGKKVKLILPWKLSIDPNCIQNINIAIDEAEYLYDQIVETVFSVITGWPQEAINIKSNPCCIELEDVLISTYVADNGYYNICVKMLFKSAIKDHEKVIGGIVINTKTKAINPSYWDNWPLDD